MDSDISISFILFTLSIFCIIYIYILISGKNISHLSVKKTKLLMGETLKAGEYIESPNGKYQLIMQINGSLILFDVVKKITIWSSNTSGYQNYALMQNDNNLIIYNDNTNNIIWTSSNVNTSNYGKAYLTIRNDRNLIIKVDPNIIIWTSKTTENN